MADVGLSEFTLAPETAEILCEVEHGAELPSRLPTKKARRIGAKVNSLCTGSPSPFLAEEGVRSERHPPDDYLIDTLCFVSILLHLLPRFGNRMRRHNT